MSSKRVHEVLAVWLKRPYSMGNADCALFAGEVAYAKTGRGDLRAFIDRLVGTYKNYEQGLQALEAALQEAGCERQPGEHPLEACCRHFFGEFVAPLQARKYDLIVGDWGEGISLGVCEGHRIIAVADDGLVRFPMTFAKKAFHV